MQAYLDKGILQPHEGPVFVERTVAGKTRKGVVLCLDLECYDYTSTSTSLIRATEGTIVQRLPPRMKIREGAALELPHILVLIDDPDRSVIEPLEQAKANLEKLYDFDLMQGSGHLCGYAVDTALEDGMVASLRTLAQPESFAARYRVGSDKPVLLFAMGDGNHSLATAKAVWEKMKSQVGMDHPARYALVEIENVHDVGLEFEPIHRVLFGVRQNIFSAMQQYFGTKFSLTSVENVAQMIQHVDHPIASGQAFGVISDGGWPNQGVVEITDPSYNLPVGTLQPFLDAFLEQGGADRIDYVHGQDVVCQLGAQPGNTGFYLPGMDKSDLFKTVILDGALPRKTFSMGEALEKRFYMEARRIK